MMSELRSRLRLASATRTRRPGRRTLIWCAVIAGLWFVLGVGAPLLAPYDPTAVNVTPGNVPPFPPGPEHWFGTDQLGRDMLSRVLYGLRTSILIGVGVRTVVMVVGVLIGYLAAFSPGIARTLLLRTTDVMLAFPALLVAMAVTAVLGPSLGTLTLALVIIGWPDVARLVYGEALALRERDYVSAARTFGAGRWHVLRLHVLRPMAVQLGVAWSVGIPGAIMYEAGLSFFGFGVQPPMPSLGSLINDGRGYVYAAPWYLVFPTLTLCLLVVSLNLVGEAVARRFATRSSTERA
jgi:peptide/nickel transport system permease protein